MKLLLKKLLDT